MSMEHVTKERSGSRRTLVTVSAAVMALGGCYVGIFLIGFAWIYQDIDGPVSIVSRLVWSCFGLVVLVPSLILLRWAWRRGRSRVAT